jgi:hypothetical protein
MTRIPIEQRLREQLTRLSDSAASVPREDVPSVVVAHGAPRRPRRLIAAIAVAAVVVATGAVAFVALRDDKTPNRVRVVGSVGDDASAEKAIRTAFLGWMNAQPHDDISEYVEDHASILESLRQGMAQHSSAGLAKYTGRVESVQIVDATHAAVRYTILFDGNPNFADQPGEAIKIDGVWKVSRDTVCNLLTNGGITCPPRSTSTTGAGG